MTITRQLASFALDTRYEDIPADVIKSAKLLILDTIGCAIGAVNTEPGLAVRQIVEAESDGAATVWGTGQKASISMAAWANGRLANVLDIDECYKVQGHHAQATLSTALALAEHHKLDGKSVIAAVVMGFDVGVRLGNYLSPRVTLDEQGRAKGWTGLVGPGQGVHGACTAAARLLQADADQLANAYGLCAQYMVGRDWSRQWGRDVELGTIKYADTGWNAQGGLMAARHAIAGVRGVRNIFDTDSYAQVFSGVILNPTALTEGLLERWYLPETSIKFWPCCRWIHYALTAYSELIETHSLRADEIESVDLLSFPMIPYPAFGSEEDPANLVAATFSFAHAAAMIALGVPPGPDWFTEENMKGEKARAMRRRMHLGVDETGYDPRTWGLEEGVLKVPSSAVIHARGQTFRTATEFARGDTWEGAPAFDADDVIAKFKRLARAPHADSSARAARVDEMAEVVMSLDRLDDVNALTRLLNRAD
ncbi:MAG: MmgE/PrpD family protein [Janthinobacterium lividum]